MTNHIGLKIIDCTFIENPESNNIHWDTEPMKECGFSYLSLQGKNVDTAFIN